MPVSSLNETGSGALSFTLTPTRDFHFDEARFHLNSAASTVEDFTVTLDSRLGSNYDVVLFNEPMANVQDLQIMGREENRYFVGDALKFVYANTDSITYGLEVRFI